jgi:hypothetical protein
MGRAHEFVFVIYILCLFEQIQKLVSDKRLKMRDTFALDCFLTYKVRPRTGIQPQSLNRLRGTAHFLANYTVQLQCLQTCPRTQGYRKEPLFHTKRRSGRDRESNPGHLLARRSAIHYALVVVFELSAKLSLKALIYILIIVPITPEIFEIDLSVYSYDIKLKRYHT